MLRPDWNINANLFATHSLAKHLQALLLEMDGVRLNQDIEHIHKMRVASRRYRNALEIFSFCFPRKTVQNWLGSIKCVTTSLGEARDKDVQIACVQSLLAQTDDPKLAPGLKRIILRLRQKRDRIQISVTDALDDLNASPVLQEMLSQLSVEMQIDPAFPVYPPALYQLSWEMTLSRLQDFLAYESFLFDINNDAELHAMRIAAKKLRYSMEIFAPLYPDNLKSYLSAARTIQELLGNIHDSFVWNQYLNHFLDREKHKILRFYGNLRGYRALEAGTTYLAEYHARERLQQYDLMLSTWQRWQSANLWQDLMTTIKTPLMER